MMGEQADYSKQLREFRTDILEMVDQNELEVLDQTFELLPIIAGIILIILQFTVQSQDPIISSFIIAMNIFFTVTIWIGYKIARIKLAIDLRLWIISISVKLSIIIAIMPFFFLVSYNPSEFSNLFIIIISAASFIFPEFVSYVRINGYLEERWLRLIRREDDESIDEEDLGSLYLVKGSIGESVYLVAPLAVFWVLWSPIQSIVLKVAIAFLYAISFGAIITRDYFKGIIKSQRNAVESHLSRKPT